jgi:mRNA-degrading endonuclease RelE of RelBE toxin-antitoxin system
LDSFLESQQELNQDAVEKFIDYLAQVTHVANCPKALGKSFYKPLGSKISGLYEIKKGRIRLVCLEVYDAKTVIIVSGFVKKDKKQQSKEIKKIEKYIHCLGLLDEHTLAEANWQNLDD